MVIEKERLMEEIVAVQTAATSRGAAWLRWLTVLLVMASLPLILMGLWISLSLGEEVYHFCAMLRRDPHFSDVMWKVVVSCRVLAWLILPFSAMQTILVGWTICGRVRSQPAGFASKGSARKWKAIALALGVLALLLTELCWLDLMAPTAAYMRALKSMPRPERLPN
jgi:hypothetical protein